ncbi:two-component system CheB/CheR fusion protein [Pontibacter mucosus]|uniref:Two-component system CheB/CheR fusion protein n=1 Tax=Pontibacter mucosus TaxID=1649266 RepID=A0A2T5YFK1_9BACT|nr:chemotaxis protein CheB [Pontibacter mucosus]PTX18100.1 two-component system CheB/CheR fusion protein [Pontibacter mucosus]
MTAPKSAPQFKESKIAPTDHYLVGIGASAGGLEAIHKLFDHFPSNSSFSFVIIQHLSPDHKSLMAELLSKHTQMQVREAEDDMFTKPNCVYVLPSGKQLTMENGRLRLSDKVRSREPNFAIDLFFESMAKSRGKYAIGIVLSGTGTDGTKGARAIRKAGGMVVVQSPESAKFDGMPRSAIDAGAADYVLTPEQMPEEIMEHTRKVPLVKSLIEQNEDGQDSEVLKEILDLICNHTQTDFTNYKEATLMRRIRKRMDYLRQKSMADYLNFLHEHPGEIKKLCQEFFINVTNFFRDPEAFECLEKEIIPQIIEAKAETEAVKVWVAACSTGEEVYSLAILFREAFDKLGREPNVKLFATDIDQHAIMLASKGSYPLSISKHVSPERLERFFHLRGNRYIINEDVRKLVVFAQHDLQKDPPYSRIDLVSCRNMLIYLNPDLQNKVLSLFPYALNLGGYLFLGSSENIGSMKSYFTEVNRKWKIFRKIKEGSGARQSYGLTDYASNGSTNGQVTKLKPAPESRYNESFMDAVSEDFKVTAFYVDEHYQLLHGIGDINRFLKFPDRRLHFNLIKMVPEELAVTLSVGIRKALKQDRKVVARQVALKLGKKEQLVHVSIRPVALDKGQPKVILVLLQELGEVTPLPKVLDLSFVSDDDYYQQLTALEAELKEAREGLHLTVQDLSTANEELQSTNEELMSSNEELQSSNEEMQSLNEELHTVNSEHQLKIKELQELNEDLDNYIRSSNIGQLFVDHHLIIRKFTPFIEGLINIIDSDLGRPIHHLSHNLKYSRLIEDIKEVNNTSVEKEQEVETVDGRFYLMRIIPYLKHDGNRDGVVVSFVDVTTLKTLSNVVQGVLNSSFNSIMAFKAMRDENQQVKDFAWTLLNRKTESVIGQSQGELLGTSVLSVMPFLRKSGLFRKFVEVVENGKSVHVEQQLEINDQKTWYEIAAVKMGDGVTVTMADITEKKNSEDKVLMAYEELKVAEENLIKLNNELEKRVAARTQELSSSEERFRMVSMATTDVIWDWDVVNNEIWWSDSLKAMLGYEKEEMGKGVESWYKLVHPNDRAELEKSIGLAINAGNDQWTGTYRVLKKDGSYAYISNRAQIMHNEYQMPYRMLGSFIDLTDLKLTQEKLQATNEHLLRVIEDLDTFVYTASHDLKTPISNIEGLLLLLEHQVAAAGPIPGEPIQPVFDMMKGAISRFNNVIKDLTDIAKVQRGIDGEPEQVDVQEVFEEVAASMQETIDSEHAQINADFSGAPQIRFSKKNLYSVLYNLISNGIKYKAAGRNPEVTLKTERVDGYVLLTVSDNGLGISRDNQTKLFTLFKRFHAHVDGTGMGLYIVKRLVDNASGYITVRSEEGVGSTFEVYFKA